MGWNNKKSHGVQPAAEKHLDQISELSPCAVTAGGMEKEEEAYSRPGMC